MQVTFKTLKQTSFKLECNEDETVASIKAKIETEKGDEFPANSQKLIHSGKIMEDSKLLKDYKVSEKGFIVVMVTTKGKGGTDAAKPEPSTEQETQSPTKAADSNQELSETIAPPISAQPSAEETPTPTAVTATTNEPTEKTTGQPNDPAPAVSDEAADSGGNDLLTGSDFEACVERIMAMGFPREEVNQAMRLSYNNPDRAVEYLISGNMPDEPPQETPADSQPQEAPAIPPVATPQNQPAAPQQTPSAGGADPFRELITQPQFQQMRQVLQQNPQLLAQLMEQLYRTNPELFQVIRNNQERFLAYLNEDSGDAVTGSIPEIGGQPPAGIADAQDPFSGSGGAGNTIRMTPDERQAIERLKDLGFPEMMVIQAYFACDKNEDAAANFLLSEAFGDDD